MELIVDKVEGVKRVRNLVVVSYIDGALESEEPWIWCPTQDESRVPNFEPSRSTINFFREKLSLFANLEKAQRLLDDRRMQQLRIRNKQMEFDLPVPVGDDMDVGDYFPVQNDLPLNYYVGQFRVPDSATRPQESASSST